MVFGTFDFVHAGHLSLFLQAKKYGDHLTVVVARDATVERVKGKLPIHTEKERVNIIRHIDLVDRVLLGGKGDKYAVVRKQRPDVIALGYDQVAFVNGLKVFFKEQHLTTRIMRMRPYKLHRKSTQIRQALSI